MLWLKSRNSEVWLERRTGYTRSTAVMSMVGYLLGLGDRHPSNLMLDRYSGKLLHIDFGDCFEASLDDSLSHLSCAVSSQLPMTQLASGDRKGCKRIRDSKQQGSGAVRGGGGRVEPGG